MSNQQQPDVRGTQHPLAGAGPQCQRDVFIGDLEELHCHERRLALRQAAEIDAMDGRADFDLQSLVGGRPLVAQRRLARLVIGGEAFLSPSVVGRGLEGDWLVAGERGAAIDDVELEHAAGHLAQQRLLGPRREARKGPKHGGCDDRSSKWHGHESDWRPSWHFGQ